MPADCYKIEVIHYLNPHLIWIEVRDTSLVNEEFIFEQVGIYGVLPLEKILDIERDDVRTQKCEDWLPASATIMKSFLDEYDELWFSPTHIDRRSSIFDDNIHKYGDIIVKSENGKLKKLSKHLMKSGFAYFNVCDFHEKLSCGKLNTKLDIKRTQEVVKDLEKFYTRKCKMKTNWKKSVEKQTSVFQMSQNLESLLTVSNIEKHNNQMLSRTLQDKIKDFELCKDIDEKSLGRAYNKTSVVSDDSNSQLLKRKLSLAKLTNTKDTDLNSVYDSIIKFVDANSNVKENSLTIESRRTNENNACSKIDSIKKENKGSFLNRKMKYINNSKKTRKDHEGVYLESNCVKLDEEGLEPCIIECNTNQNNHKVENLSKQETMTMDHLGNQLDDMNLCNISTRTKKSAETNTGIKAQVAYGPPGINPQMLKIQEMTVQDYDVTDPDIDFQNETDIQKGYYMFGDVDSEVGIEITNKVSSECYKNMNTTGIENEQIICKENKFIRRSDFNVSDDSDEKKTSCSSSLFLQRKLRACRNSTTNHDTSFSSSDTSNKDSSSYITPVKKSDEEEEDIEIVLERIHTKYGREEKKIDSKPCDDFLNLTQLKNNVNPFKNIDPKISVFVDKLVTPVLMVHSKHNVRVQPVFEMRDVYFNSHIHNILKNMSVEHPMMLQTISWYMILRGYSVFMVSPLGSGKTLGYLPAVCRLVSDSNASSIESRGPICIIVCATAKSVTNVERLAKTFVKSAEKVLACYAGVDSLDITTALLNGCDLLISTPSALVRLLQVTEFAVDLRRLSTFVLDDCERLVQVYSDEIKYFLYRIRQMLKFRVCKELKVQYIVASRIWSDFMDSLAKRVPDTVISIGAFQECVLYSKANTSVTFVKSDVKIDSVFEFLKEINRSKKSVIVCKTDDEVRLLEKALKRSKHVVFASDNNMNIHDLYNLSVSWSDYDEPLIGPILICCDGNLIHMNITDAHNLIHFSLPPLFSMFCKRFSVLNDNYPSIFKSENESVKIKILLEEGNVDQLPKILNFIRRCTDKIPSALDEICSNILLEKDLVKAKKLHPICDSLLTLGYCPDFYNCKERHTILKEYDTPKDWLPKKGVINCKIIHYHTATLYSARLLSCTVDGITTTYPQTYSKLSLNMGIHYSKESNRKLHGIPKIGDVCATSIKLNFYVRCQVLKILSKYQRGNPNNVLVRLIDEERFEVTRDIYLYHLPKELQQIEARVVHVRLANIEPKDKDITFSDLARDRIKNIIDTDTELFVRGNISLTIGNCIFVNTLEVCQELTSLNQVIVKCNLKSELLEHDALPNPNHLHKLEKLCINSGLLMNQEELVQENNIPIKNLPRGTWAHLDSDTMSRVYFASVVTPDKFFVRHVKFETCMSSLLQDIKKYVDTNPTSCENVKEGELVLAKFPDDSTYERARVDGLNEGNAKCFFVDQGDWREVSFDHLVPITEQLINQLPLQAVECRLIGIKPVGDQWTDFSTNWFSDNCYNDDGDLKHLFVKYFTKEPAEFTNGHKYSVALIDTSTEQDIIINQLMIDLNLAQEYEDEMKYLDNIEMNIKGEKSSEAEDDGWEAISATSIDCNKQEQDNFKTNTNSLSQSNILFKTPIRSVPLVNSDNESDDSDKWDVNFDDNCMELFSGLKVLKNLQESTSKIDKIVQPTETCIKPENNVRAEIIELDSDDLTSPDNTHVSILPEKPKLITLDQRRRPKLVWRQSKNVITVKIQLIGVDNYKIDIGERELNFSAIANDTEYQFDLKLYGVIDKEQSIHMNKEQYILVKLTKVLKKNWLTLTRDGGIKKWIVYDVDSIDPSSEEEFVDDNDVKNIVRNIHNNVDSDTDDDDDFGDDVDRTYKKYN